MPLPYSDGFFNRAWVQNALGVPVNYTMNSYTIYNGAIPLMEKLFAEDRY